MNNYPITPKWLYTLSTQYLGFKDFGVLHKYLCQRICEPRTAQVRLILIPRGFFKTSLFTYAHNTALALEDPNVRILQCSGVLANAKIMIMKWGKTFTHNEIFRDRFKEFCPKNPENPETKWTESAIYLPNRTAHHAEGTLEAFGADSTIVSRHYDYMKFDDIVTPENCTTKDQMNKIIRFVKECFGLCDNRMKTPIDIIGTTWDDGDLYAHYLQEQVNVEVIKIPATYQRKAGNTIGISLPFKEDESIFPERYPTDELEKVRKEDPETYAKFYDLDPVPMGDRTFTDFYYYDSLEDLNKYRKFMTVDPAPTKSPTSNFSAINVTAVDNEKNMFCMLSWRDKVNPDKLIDKIWEIYFNYDCELLGIETDVYQIALKYWLYERIIADEENRNIRIQELKARGRAKEDRIAALAPYVNTGKYRFLRSQTTLTYSLSRFPKAKDRDEADAAAYQLYLVKPSGYKIVKKENPNSLNAWKKRIARYRNQTSIRGGYVGS
ncbi:MAG: hypothetical protein ACW990_05555 [Promethearchaeota archaeon]